MQKLQMLKLGVMLAGAFATSACYGGSVEQSEPCAQFVRAIIAEDAAMGTSTDLARYIEDGECWGNSTIAALCTRSCERTLERSAARVAPLMVDTP